MNIFKNLSYIVSISLLYACNDPDIIGIDLPGTETYTISNESIENLVLSTVSVDSLRSDESMNLLLGQINSPVFGENTGKFATQMLLPSNNISQITNIVVDSVFITYSYSDFYGDLENEDLEISVYELTENIYKDSVYYSNKVLEHESQNLSIAKILYTGDSLNSAYIKIQLNNSYGEKIMNETGNPSMQDNPAFLEYFKGFYVEATATNTIMYLNPDADKSRFSIYYHENGIDTSISLDFEIGGDAARINMFNDKINIDTTNVNEAYVQSMAGYKAKVQFSNLNNLIDTFSNRAINRVIIDFDIIEDIDYDSHDKLYLVRETNEDQIVFLTDFTIEGDEHFGGELGNGKYSFNITRYFTQLLTNQEYTNTLYLLSSSGSANANQTIIDKNNITINIISTEL